MTPNLNPDIEAGLSDALVHLNLSFRGFQLPLPESAVAEVVVYNPQTKRELGISFLLPGTLASLIKSIKRRVDHKSKNKRKRKQYGVR